MICPKCKAENAEGSAFCSLCYTKFTGPSIGLRQEELYAEIAEKHREARIKCPNCSDVQPISTMWCNRCGFIFENREELIISDEEAQAILTERENLAEKDLRETMSEPIEVTPEADGGLIIRNVQDILKAGNHPRLHASGRNAITYAIRLITLMSEEARRNNQSIRISSYLLTEGQVVHPDDLSVELVVELV